MSFSSLGNSAPQVWEATLGQLLLRVTRQNYETWLRNTVGLRFEATTLIVAAPNELACDWLSTRLRSVVAQALTAVAGAGLKVRFEPVESPAAFFDNPVLQPELIPGLSTPLNPRFTFSAFLACDFNQLPLNAAQELAAGKGQYSPLFITGPSGSGKTHLLHAIAHEAAAMRTSFLLAGAEQFLSEFTTAIRNKAGAAFRARYREVDLLLIDDIHVLTGKKATLSEFYQTVAGLHDLGKLVAVNGEPSAMNGGVKRFENQLRWGLVAPITDSSMADRIRFTAMKAENQGVDLPEEAQQYIALRVRGSVRDLEGAINRVTALARISRETLTLDFVNKALEPASQESAQEPVAPAPAALLQAVSEQFALSISVISSAKRNRELTYARHIAMYLMRNDGGLTYSAIATLLGKKDHSTVVHACTQVAKQIKQSPSLRADVDAIRALVHKPTTAA